MPDTLDPLSLIASHVPGILFQFHRAADGFSAFPYVSGRSLPLIGLEPAELMHNAEVLLRRVDFADRESMLASIAASAATLAPWRLEFRIHRRDGVTRWMRGEASPQRLAGGATIWAGYIEDVTERRELERARHDAAVAAEANRAKTEFLSRMSHELRTPLNAVLGFTQLLEIDAAEPPTEGQRRRLRLVREAGEHLLQMIGDLLDLTRIETGRITLRLEPVDLRALVEDSLEMMRTAAERAQVTSMVAPGGADLAVRADRTRLRQVVLNLLGNAIKYNRPGGRVELRVLRLDDAEVQLVVSDTGVGIAEAELPHLFDPFWRGVQGGAGVEGAGIGLAVTQSLVQLMDGRIDVTSTPGAGSAFRVTLPAFRA